MNELDNNIIDTKEKLSFEEILAKVAIDKLEKPFTTLTVKDVAKDLKMGENLTNELFKRKDLPSVNIGKQKTVTLLAYLLWKMQKQDNFEKGNKDNEY